MTKTAGMGDNLLVGGYNLSGDIGSLESINASMDTFDDTGIDKFAHERLGLLRDGGMKFTAYFNPSSGQSHPVLSALPSSDVVVSYLRGTTLGNAGAACIGKQINYDGKRGKDGSLVFDTDVQANGYGLEWGVQLTAGRRTDTGATQGTGVLFSPPVTGTGAQAYLQVTAFSGTDVTIAVQDSNDNVSFANVSGLVFTTVNAGNPAPFTQRLATTNTATVKQYLRVTTTTSSGFTSVTFNVIVAKNSISGVVF